MNITDYTYIINKPDAITEKQTEALGDVLNEFPYFQSARALRLKGLYNQNSFKYNYALKITAAHTTDRSVLFDFITSENFTSIQGKFYERKLRDLLDITVFDSEILLAEEMKETAETRINPIEQSILDSIKEATGVVYSEESVQTDEQLIEQSISIQEKETETTIFEEPVKIDDIPFGSRSILIDAPVFYEEEPVKSEELPTNQVIEQSVAIDANENLKDVSVEFKEIKETAFHPIEESKIIVIPDTSAVVWEEKQNSVEVEIDAIIEEPNLTVKETATIVFEEAEKTNEATIHLIEESDIISIPDTTAVVWEEEKNSELPIDLIEEQKTILINETSKITEKELKSEKVIDEPVKKAEENLEIGKPLDFSVNEKHSFQEWLQLAKPEPIDRTNKAPKEISKAENKPKDRKIDTEKKKKEEIINKFIETNPKIPPIKQTAITPAVQLDINKEENSYLMTETLARVYLEQKKYTKAIQAYEILILKYPEKISFFADRISDIKILQQNNNNN